MNKDIYTDAPQDVEDAMDLAVPVRDFLPPPEDLARLIEKKKITINLDKVVVDDFRRYAKKNGLKYQSLINQVLKNYAENRL